ncbi:unnamed protein product [Somion occarium]|uniref:Uncharacterized protein n=1 Tax=Somion occarium TaxID=3059160 RepID=A0ABP1DGV7_9APHY
MVTLHPGRDILQNGYTLTPFETFAKHALVSPPPIFLRTQALAAEPFFDSRLSPGSSFYFSRLLHKFLLNPHNPYDMRYSTVIALSLVATAGPSLAIPLSNSGYARELLSRQPQSQTQEVDQSGALRLGDFLPLIGPIVDTIFGNQRRDLNEISAREFVDALVARQAQGDDESGAGLFDFIPIFGPIIEKFFGGGAQRRDLNDIYVREFVDALVARQEQSDEESGAGLFSFIPLLVNTLFGRDLNEVSAREFVDELVARQAQGDDESGAGLFDFIPIFGPIIEKFLGGGAQRRDLNELSARDFVDALIARQEQGDEESGAGLFSFIPLIVNTLFGRDLNEVTAREFVDTLVARGDQAVGDESGALRLGDFLPLLGPIVDTIFGGGNQRRDFSDLEAREFVEALLAREEQGVDASGALRLGDFIPLIGPLIDHILGGGNQAQRRDLHEFVAREETVARSLNELD